jgi:hypothetical protein
MQLTLLSIIKHDFAIPEKLGPASLGNVRFRILLMDNLSINPFSKYAVIFRLGGEILFKRQQHHLERNTL